MYLKAIYRITRWNMSEMNIENGTSQRAAGPLTEREDGQVAIPCLFDRHLPCLLLLHSRITYYAQDAAHQNNTLKSHINGNMTNGNYRDLSIADQIKILLGSLAPVRISPFGQSLLAKLQALCVPLEQAF